jgi:hypothetical protein
VADHDFGHHDLGGEFRSDFRELLLDTIDRVAPILEAARSGPPDATYATT